MTTRNKRHAAHSETTLNPLLRSEPTPDVAPKPRTYVRRRDGNGSIHGNGKRYSDDDKMKAVTAMLAQNREHPFSDASLEAARAAMGFDVPISTLKQWQVAYRDKALALLPASDPKMIVETTYNNLATSLVLLQTKLLARANNQDVIDKAQLRDVVVALGIIIDKMKAMIGLSTSTVLIVRQLEALCDRLGVPIDDVLTDVANEARRRLDDEAAARRAKMLPGGDIAQIVDGESGEG